MDRHHTDAAANGFSLLEMLLVLLIIQIAVLLAPVKNATPSLPVFMEQLTSSLTLAQMEAFSRKETIVVEIHNNRLYFKDTVFEFPDGIGCTPKTLSFNEKGNVNMAGHVDCQQGNQSMKLIWQLGSGRIRYE